MAGKETPSQTAGPYVHIGLVPNWLGIGGVYPSDPGARTIVGPVAGEEITVSGTIFDGTGAPVRDALVEIWQADAHGVHHGPGDPRDADPGFAGWARQGVDMETGLFTFGTVKPGRVPFPDGRMQAPHIGLWIVARGINLGLHTRLYFEDEAEANAEDPLLARIDQPDRRRTLLATREAGGRYRFDIRLQGPGETVFLDI